MPEEVPTAVLVGYPLGSNERSRRLALVILRDIHARRKAGNIPLFVICGYKCGEIQRGYDKVSWLRPRIR